MIRGLQQAIGVHSKAAAMLVCMVPSAEVLALTAELQQLGGGDVAVGNAWAGAVVPTTAATAAAAAAQLDATAADWASLTEALHSELRPWLQRGFGAAVLLLGGSASSVAAIAAAACAGTLGGAGRVGVSWQLLSGGVVRDPWGRRQQSSGANSSRRPGAAPRPTSRFAAQGAATAAGSEEDAEELCTIAARTPAELSQLLETAEAQLQAAAAVAVGEPTSEPQPQPALMLHLSLAAADGRPSAALHLLHLPAAQGAAAEQQQEALCRLLREAADLHQRRREGDHLLATAKLSPLNQLAAPLLAGSTRLFIAADLLQREGGSGSSSGTGSSGSQQGLLPLLVAVRHMQAACAKGRAAAQTGKAGGAAASPDSWLPAQQFLEQLEQRRLAELQRKAEAAALAAAEADRRARLQQAAKERQQAVQGQPEPPVAQQLQPQQPKLAQQPAADSVQPPGGYRPSPYGSPNKPSSSAAQQPQLPSRPAEKTAAAGGQQDAAADQAAATTKPPGDPAQPFDPQPDSSIGSLQQLRQQFQSLYSLTLGPGAASPPLQQQVPSAAPAAAVPAKPAHPPAVDHRTIADGVAAADDIAVHVAALRMQAAAEARRALQAEQQLLEDHPSGGCSTAAAAEPAAFTCAARYGGHRSSSSEGGSAAGGSRPSSGGGLAQQLQEELLLLQRQAAQAAQHVGAGQQAAGPAASPQGGSLADFSTADLASLADLEGPAPSLGALGGQSASRGGSLQGRQQSQLSSMADEWQQQEQYQQATAGGVEEQRGRWQQAALGVGATPQSRPSAPAVSPLRFFSPSAAPVVQSDVFKSANLPLWSENKGPAAGSDGIDQPPAAGISSSHSSWRGDRSGAAGASRPSSRPQSAGSSRQLQGKQGAGSSGPAGSYAAAWRRQTATARPSAATSPPSNACSSQGPPGLQLHRSVQPVASDSELAAVPSSAATSSLRQPSELGQSELAPAELTSAEVAGLLEELQREQRISSALLQQLHEVQRQLEEAAAMAAAAAAVQQPPVPGVQDPADFNGMLAALQLERQQCAALRQQLELLAQQAEEAQLALEARLHTHERQLLVASARCRAWEQGTPLASLFRRYEEDLQRLAAERGQLQEENCQLARLLAAADLERLAAAAQRLPEEPAAVCREHQRKLAQAQSQVRKLQEERAALAKRLQGAERRDRLAELCRRQAESGAKAAAELRQQLAGRERQLEAQSLAAAAAAGEAERLRQQLEEREVELGRALADRAELEDTVDSLRKQVAVLKGQLSRDRVLRSMQA